MNFPFQMFGTIEIGGDQLDAMLCRDLDLPDELMISWPGSKTHVPGGILMKAVEDGVQKYSLKFLCFYAEDSNGGLYIPPVSALENFPDLSRISASLQLKLGALVGTWSGPGDFGGAVHFNVASKLPRVRARKLRSWSEFKKWASDKHLEGKFFDFRGHGCNSFKLISAFHRTGRARMERFCYETMPQFQVLAESVLDTRFNRANPDDFAVFIGLAQHHGLPTPLLDWSASPYVAAFFAFSDALENGLSRSNSTHVRIYALGKAVSAMARPIVTLTQPSPHASYLNIAPWKNPRLLAQQGRFLLTNVADLEGFLCNAQRKMDDELLTAVDIPIRCVAEALEDLQFMGLSAASMFPGLDGIGRMMKHQMHFRRKN